MPSPGSGPVECRCPQDRADLLARVDGVERPVRPHPTLGAVEALYRARCRACGREYRGHWRLARPEPRTAPSWPEPAVRQEMLW